MLMQQGQVIFQICVKLVQYCALSEMTCAQEPHRIATQGGSVTKPLSAFTLTLPLLKKAFASVKFCVSFLAYLHL